MSVRKTAILLVTLAASLTVLGMVVAMPSSFDLWWHVIAGGGGRSASADYAVSGSIGQPAVGGSSGADYRLDAGFWPGIGAETPTPTVTGSPSPTSTATPTGTPTAPTATPTSTATPTATPTSTPGTKIYLPLILRTVGPMSVRWSSLSAR